VLPAAPARAHRRDVRAAWPWAKKCSALDTEHVPLPSRSLLSPRWMVERPLHHSLKVLACPTLNTYPGRLDVAAGDVARLPSPRIQRRFVVVECL
jgi:hypothetical protein